MTYQVDLLKSLPKTKRDPKLLGERRQLKEYGMAWMSQLFAYSYFDGPRKYGYGGYHYDRRWVSVAKDIIEFYKLTPGSRILDIGCAKGYLAYEFLSQGMDAYGLDISMYAIKNCYPEIVGRLYKGDAVELHFPDNSFDLVVSINTLHNLEKHDVIRALKEITRVSKKYSFITVDSYHTAEQKKLFEDWMLTAKFHGYPQEWIALFDESGYNGHYSWTILEIDDE